MKIRIASAASLLMFGLVVLPSMATADVKLLPRSLIKNTPDNRPRSNAIAKNRNNAVTSTTPTSSSTKCRLPSWFRPAAPTRTRWLSFSLLVWNCAALTDCIAYTFFPAHSLDRYLEGEWGPHALAQTRMLANCQMGLIASIALIALEGSERMIRTALRLLIIVTFGAFRAVYAGIKEGTISPIFESAWASLLSLPPLLFLCYFAFVF